MAGDKKPKKSFIESSKKKDNDEKGLEGAVKVGEVKKQPDILTLLYSKKEELAKVQNIELTNAIMRNICKELRLRHDKHLESQTQIISHLNLEDHKKAAKLAELTAIVNELQENKKKLASTRETSISDLELRHNQERYDLNVATEIELTAYRDFSATLAAKIKLEGELAILQEALTNEKREHTLEVGTLERRNVIEKEMLNKQMLLRIDETKENLLAMTADQLHRTTKCTIVENDRMTGELLVQSKEAEKAVEVNKKLIKENKDLRCGYELLQQAQAMLVSRARKQQAAIKKLNESISTRSLERAIKPARVQVIGSSPEESVSVSQVLIQQLNERVRNLEDVLQAADETLALAEKQLHDELKTMRKILGAQNESLSFTLMCVEDVQASMSDKSKSNPSNSGEFHSENARPNSAGLLPPISSQSFTSNSDEIKLGSLLTLESREDALDRLIEKFNTFSLKQQRLLTHVA